MCVCSCAASGWLPCCWSRWLPVFWSQGKSIHGVTHASANGIEALLRGWTDCCCCAAGLEWSVWYLLLSLRGGVASVCVCVCAALPMRCIGVGSRVWFGDSAARRLLGVPGWKIDSFGLAVAEWMRSMVDGNGCRCLNRCSNARRQSIEITGSNAQRIQDSSSMSEGTCAIRACPMEHTRRQEHTVEMPPHTHTGRIAYGHALFCRHLHNYQLRISNVIKLDG